MPNEPLVSISEASQILGVSETALRQWTDEGKIKAFVTPGGHRRYLVADLRKFMGSHHRSIGIRDLAAELEETAPLHRQISVTFLSKTTWYQRLTKESQEDLASQGRRMLRLIVRYVTVPAERGGTVKESRELGTDLGVTLARIGLPLTDSVEAFIMHRDPMMNVVTEMLKKREAISVRVADAIPLVARVMDEALVALVAAHQQYRGATQSKEPD